jgi:hypothetical protein
MIELVKILQFLRTVRLGGSESFVVDIQILKKFKMTVFHSNNTITNTTTHYTLDSIYY